MHCQTFEDIHAASKINHLEIPHGPPCFGESCPPLTSEDPLAITAAKDRIWLKQRVCTPADVDELKTLLIKRNYVDESYWLHESRDSSSGPVIRKYVIDECVADEDIHAIFFEFCKWKIHEEWFTQF